ncbi:bifunctional DNA primase/polymerase [Saccharomonospora azurea]|uniref:bifunctional DNA primase/polymerase n=1 Tax=Saccharomonospora azurea TaxID=40988 RepID=UPI00240A2D66|nr:bifunctional DNA primase/polymerase [Saccharomonospora azurea]
MVDTEWPNSWRAAFRIELRAEAIGLAWRGWPVVPGTYPDADTTVGTPNTETLWTRPAPAHSDWQSRIGAHPQQVAAWWTGRPYSVLVATGTLVDAIEVDDHLGRRAAMLLRGTGRPAPIVAMPNGRWLFLVASADHLPRELDEAETVEWHGEGSWIPLPPTPFHHGVVHWRVKPDVWGWNLPPAPVVHDVLLRALNDVSAPRTDVPQVVPVESSAA